MSREHTWKTTGLEYGTTEGLLLKTESIPHVYFDVVSETLQTPTECLLPTECLVSHFLISFPITTSECAYYDLTSEKKKLDAEALELK